MSTHIRLMPLFSLLASLSYMAAMILAARCGTRRGVSRPLNSA
jgi:hypothetical protein